MARFHIRCCIMFSEASVRTAGSHRKTVRSHGYPSASTGIDAYEKWKRLMRYKCAFNEFEGSKGGAALVNAYANRTRSRNPFHASCEGIRLLAGAILQFDIRIRNTTMAPGGHIVVVIDLFDGLPESTARSQYKHPLVREQRGRRDPSPYGLLIERGGFIRG